MMSRLLISAALLVALTSCKNDQQRENAPLNEQRQTTADSNAASAPVALPSFSIRDIRGNIVDLKNSKGKKLFVNLWASWCPPCKREMPSIEKLFHSVDSNKVKFVMVSYDDQAEKAKKFVSSKGFTLPVYFPAENPPALFDVQGIPATFIFNENGELIRHVDGSENYDTKEYRALLQ